ncbi:hypothetical protein [Streptomyces sp. AMCC400023]|uniref:hypothetical protein n=1 Tax=Streptomyces sp. AMCC400023 TaxID=2056258 RepID=UPI001F1FC6C8|nr:hypothetical protein [Streptomyces sp. AMCC400023]UJV43798.1 hypothetical protein CVT30_31755 [Streptomyces sp. AMCC400023]
MAGYTLTQRQAGQDWLLACAPDADAAQLLWDEEELVRFPTGKHWRVAEAPLALAMDVMRRIPDHSGPVLADVAFYVASWLLPADLGDELDDVKQLTVRPAGWALACPPVLYGVRGRVWLRPPDGSGQLTDPVLLGAAFGPGGARLPTEALR